jgi:NitT/TauT family transport system substrate-binding protein
MVTTMKKRWWMGVVALVAGLGMAGAAHAVDKVRLRLNWMYYGSHAGFALGKDKGYYSDAGIDLDIRSGNGSGSAHRLVANGDSTFSYGSCASMINLASQGADLVSVAVIDAMGTEAVLVKPDAGVKAVTDLKGKSLLTTANAGVNTFFPLVLKTAGLAPSDVKLINVPESALVSGYIQGSGGAVGILGGLDDKPAEIKAAGGPAPIGFPYSESGVNQVGYCIVSTRKTVDSNPELVKRFVQATIKSYKEAEANPETAVAAMADIVGGTMNEPEGKAQALAVLKVTLGVLYSPANREKKLGLHVASDWDDMLALMKSYNNLETTKPASAFYSNSFLP